MRADTKELFHATVQVSYSGVSLYGLSGKNRSIKKYDPFGGLSHVQISHDYFSVGTFTSDIFEDVELRIFEGYPDQEDLSPHKFCVSGIIEVGDVGLILDTGGTKEAVIRWPKGLTTVFVALNSKEVENLEVRRVTFFLKYLGDESKKSRLCRFWSVRNR